MSNTRCGNCDHYSTLYFRRTGRCLKYKKVVRGSTDKRPCFTPRPTAPKEKP